MPVLRWSALAPLSPRVRDVRRRRALAEVLDGHAARAKDRRAAGRLALIAAVLRSPLALPDLGVAAVRVLADERHGPLVRPDLDLEFELDRVEDRLGMRGRRAAARAIAAGEIAAGPPAGAEPER